MPEEITSQSQARKRKERKKKGKDSLDRVGFKHEDDDEPFKGHKGTKDEMEEDESSEDIRDDGRHSTTNGGILSTTVFLILLGGLVLLTALIYIELKDSKAVGPTITDSRYASYLGEFVEEPEAEEEHLEHYDATAGHSAEDEDEDEEDALHELHSTDHSPSPETPTEAVADTTPVPDAVPVDIVDQPSIDSFDGSVENTQQQEEVVPELLTISEDEGINEEQENVVPDVVEDSYAEETKIEDEASILPTATEVVQEATEQPQIQVSETQSEPQITETPSEPQVTETLPEPPVPETPTEPQVTEESSEPHLEEEKSPEYDDQIENELKEAQQEMEKSLERSLHMYEGILVRYPLSPQATYGKAQCLDRLSEKKKSNTLLDDCIRSYTQLLQLPNIPDSLFRIASERCADRMKFRGYMSRAADVEQSLMRKFPNDIEIQKRLAVTYLQMGSNAQAKSILEQVMRVRPEDGFAKVHYGFILKTDESLYKEAIKYLSEGISTEEEGTVDGRFYFHLGDALAREGQVQEAYKVYEDGVQKGLFRSVYQRSLYNEDNLTGRPWWTPEQTTYQDHLKVIESHWQVIRQEAMSLLDETNAGFIPESEGLRDTGVWKQFELFARGRKVAKNCNRAPFTCKLVEGIKSASGCTRGQIKFSLMHPGTHVWAHTGPTNCRIRAHLGLVVPEGVRIRVANETRTWIAGKFIIFDDSFEHEVFHEGTSIRLVLIVDFWHPELSEQQRRTLTPI